MKHEFKVGDRVVSDLKGPGEITGFHQDLSRALVRLRLDNGLIFWEGLGQIKLLIDSAPCLNLEIAPCACKCELRELLMQGCKCGGY
jgi:hypothetical protein